MQNYSYNAQELMQLAIQIEKNGKKYYQAMTEKADNPKVKDIFTFLAREEQNHLDTFVGIRNKIIENEADYAVADEYQTAEMYAYVEAMSDGQVFPNTLSYADVIKEIKTDEQAICHAITFEKDTILFFYEIMSMFKGNESAKAIIEELIRQEKTHVVRLHTLLAQVK